LLTEMKQMVPMLPLLTEMKQMVPMLPPMEVPTGNRDKYGRPQMKTSVGKYSYPQDLRIGIFRFAISEIRKHFAGPVALCKETVDVWRAIGLDPSQCQCVCQYDTADLLRRDAGAVHTSSKNTGETPVNEGGKDASDKNDEI
jgi:hypothetical protein